MAGSDKIQQFLDKVGNLIHTECEAEAIKLEMMAHIQTAKEEYLGASFTEEEAVLKALKDMGDPTEIGYAFTDYEAVKRRHLLHQGLKWGGVAMLCAFMAAILYSDFQMQTQDGIQLIWTMVYLVLNVYVIKFSMGMRADRTAKTLDIDVKPLFIVWPVKKPLPFEYKMLGLIFSPILLTFLLLFIYEATLEGYLLIGLLRFFIFAMGIFMFFYSEVYRIPKVVIVDEGMIIKGKFLSWTAVNTFRMRFIKSSKGNYYKLELVGSNRVQVASGIHISEKQKPFVAQLISERV